MATSAEIFIEQAVVGVNFGLLAGGDFSAVMLTVDQLGGAARFHLGDFGAQRLAGAVRSRHRGRERRWRLTLGRGAPAKEDGRDEEYDSQSAQYVSPAPGRWHRNPARIPPFSKYYPDT